MPIRSIQECIAKSMRYGHGVIMTVVLQPSFYIINHIYFII